MSARLVRPHMIAWLPSLLAVMSAGAAVRPILAQDPTVAEKASRDRIEANSKTFRFGLSVGWRHIPGASIAQDVAIDPITQFVQVDTSDNGAVVLSGVVTAFPWRNPVLADVNKQAACDRNDSSCANSALALWRLGFIANINLASFTQDNIAVFNKSVEGGLGVAYKLNEEFSLALTAERVFGRSLRHWVKPGSVLKDAKGEIVTQLDAGNTTYLHDDNKSALSMKFVYFFK